MAMVDEEKLYQQAQDKFFRDVQNGNVSAVSVAIQKKPLKNFRGNIFHWLTMLKDDSQTAFHLAAEAGQVAMLELLAQNGSDIHVVDQAGETGLHAAASRNHTQAMEVMLGLGLKINAASNSGATPLHVAAWRKNLDAMQLLLESRADVERADSKQETPLGFAARNNMPVRALTTAALLRGAHHACSLLCTHTPA